MTTPSSVTTTTPPGSLVIDPTGRVLLLDHASPGHPDDDGRPYAYAVDAAGQTWVCDHATLRVTTSRLARWRCRLTYAAARVLGRGVCVSLRLL